MGFRIDLRPVRVLVLLAAGPPLAAAGAAGLLVVSRADFSGTEAFPLIETQAIYDVFDAGAGDLDGDGRIDRWTVNHSGGQWIDLDGAGRDDALAAGLAQDPALPGLEQSAAPVPWERPVRLYMDDARFVLEARGLGGGTVEGSFTLPWEAETRARGGARMAAEPCDEMPNCHRFRFALRSGGRVEMLPVPVASDGFAIRIAFAEGTDLTQVQIGSEAIRPPAHAFAYVSKDRHGLALADPDGDGAPDLFVSRGGARGRLSEIEPDARDEYFEWQDGRFAERIAATGIEKQGCPGRQTAWVDADLDGDLDLYQVCGRGNPPNDEVPNRLYLQGPDGRFAEGAAAAGLALPGSGSFRFLRDARPGAPLVMLWATQDRLALHVLGAGGRYAEAWSLPRQGSGSDRIAVGDLEGDGLWEAFVLSPRGSLLLRPAPEGPVVLDPAALGLPAAGADGVFLDIDADGRRDFFAVPQGLFLGTAAGFRKSDALALPGGIGGTTRFAWLDADRDGDPDLWLVRRHAAHAPGPVRQVYDRAPGWLQAGMERLLGRAALRRSYWIGALYENRLAGPGARLALPEAPGAGAGMPVEIAVAGGAGGPRTLWRLSGEADTARFSMTFPYLPVALGPGEEIVGLRPLLPERMETRLISGSGG